MKLQLRTSAPRGPRAGGEGAADSFSVCLVGHASVAEKNQDRMGNIASTRESGLFALADGDEGRLSPEGRSRFAVVRWQTPAAIHQRGARPTVKDPPGALYLTGRRPGLARPAGNYAVEPCWTRRATTCVVRTVVSTCADLWGPTAATPACSSVVRGLERWLAARDRSLFRPRRARSTWAAGSSG